jgi:hypothetical protein
VITKNSGSGYYIIGTGLFFENDNMVVSYPDDTPVQQFTTEELLLIAHREQFPEEYTD